MKKKMGLKEGVLVGGIISSFLVLGTLIYLKINTNDSLFAESNGKEPTIIYENEKTNFTGKKFLSNNYTISTSNDDLLEVNGDSLTATQTGTYTIYATDEDGKVHKEEVIVCKKLTKDSLQAGQITLTEGETLAINLDLGENDACYENIDYKIENQEIASIKEKAKVYGVQAGQTQMTITQNGEKVYAPVYIFAEDKTIEAESITLAPDYAKIQVNQEKIINAIISPSNTTNKAILWTTSNGSVATINNGKIIGRKPGVVTITATTANGKKATAKIEVVKYNGYTISYAPGTGHAQLSGTMSSTNHNIGINATVSVNNYKIPGWSFLGFFAEKNGEYYGCDNNQVHSSNCAKWTKTAKSLKLYKNSDTLEFGKYLESGEKVTLKGMWGTISSAKITGTTATTVKPTVTFVLPTRTTWSIRVYNGQLLEVARYYTGTNNTKYTLDKYIAKGNNNYIKVNACLVQDGKVTGICVNNVTLYTGYTISYSPGTSHSELTGKMNSISYNIGTTATAQTNKYSIPGWKFVGYSAIKGNQTFGNNQARTKEVGYTSSGGNWLSTNNLTTIAVYSNGSQLGFSKGLKNETVTLKALWGRVINGKVISKDNGKIKFSVNFTLPTKTVWDIRANNGSVTKVLNRKYVDKGSFEYTATVDKGSTGKIYVNACLVQNGKTTNVCINPTTLTFSNFKQYNLTEYELKSLARLCEQEQGSPKGAAAEASLMANRYELFPERSDSSSLYNYVRNTGWWANRKYYMDLANPSAEVLKAVRDVLINGNRTLPLYVDEHDYIGDVVSVITNGANHGRKEMSKYISGKTKIKNNAGAEYTFYAFYGNDDDPFGYTKEAYNRAMDKK